MSSVARHSSWIVKIGRQRSRRPAEFFQRGTLRLSGVADIPGIFVNCSGPARRQINLMHLRGRVSERPPDEHRARYSPPVGATPLIHLFSKPSIIKWTWVDHYPCRCSILSHAPDTFGSSSRCHEGLDTNVSLQSRPKTQVRPAADGWTK